MKWILVLMMVWVSGEIQGQTLTAKEIVKKAEDKMRGTTSAKSDMTITTIRPKWSRAMTMKSWSLGDDYSLMLITSPSKDKGITFLKRKKEVWNWVPSIERTIKLPPSMMSQSWMGTDLTNDELVQESSNVSDYTHKKLANKNVDGAECYQIELVPLSDANVVYDRMVVFIDVKNFVQRRAEMYDEDDEMVQLMKSGKVKMIAGKELATEMEYFPLDKEGHSTKMQINSIEFDIEIEENFFTIQNMKRVK